MKALEYNITPLRWMACKALGVLSQRAYYGAMSGLRLVERRVPKLPGPEWVRLRTRLGGICGTDLALIGQRMHPASFLRGFADFPAVLGHENVAEVESIGSAVADWRVGQRVCVEPALGCVGRGAERLCAQCAAGRATLCCAVDRGAFPFRALVGLNTVTGGSWSEYFIAHQSQLHAVTDSVPDEIAVLLDPIASAAHAVLRRPPKPGESVLVNGSGIIALGVIASIRALGGENSITAACRPGFRAELARRMGASHVLEESRSASSASRYDAVAKHVGGARVAGRFGNQGMIGGFDLTYDCTGSGAGLGDALKWTRSRGCVVTVGTSGITLLDTTPIWFDEMEVIGSNGRQVEEHGGRSIHTYDLVLEWIRDGKMDLSALPVGRYGLEDYRSAFAQLLGGGPRQIVKAVLSP